MIQVLHGSCLEELAKLPAGHFHCCVTSPPYWGLRDYGTPPLVMGGDPLHAHDFVEHVQPAANGIIHDGGMSGETLSGTSATRKPKRSGFCECGAWRGHIGLEPTPEHYVANQVLIFREVRRVLRDDGTLWLNIGDCWNAYNGGAGPGSKLSKTQSEQRPHLESGYGLRDKGLKAKDLVGIPWRLAFALQADGWYLRSEIIWHKRNGMPESVRDRPSKAHEQLFLLTKSRRYFYDGLAVAEPVVRGAAGSSFLEGKTGVNGDGRNSLRPRDDASIKNARDVWSLSLEGYKGAHFAVMPSELVRRCLRSGTSERGCCSACGKPWRRLTEKNRVPTRPGTSSKVNRASAFEASPYNGHSGDVVGNRDPHRHCTEIVTVGWEAACACGGEPVRCRTLDPFGGSGTVGQVAAWLGLDATLIELNAAYLPLIEERVKTLPRCAKVKQEKPATLIAEPMPLFE